MLYRFARQLPHRHLRRRHLQRLPQQLHRDHRELPRQFHLRRRRPPRPSSFRRHPRGHHGSHWDYTRPGKRSKMSITSAGSSDIVDHHENLALADRPVVKVGLGIGESALGQDIGEDVLGGFVVQLDNDLDIALSGCPSSRNASTALSAFSRLEKVPPIIWP